MPDTTTTTNMSLVLPVVSTRIGPAYASDINSALTLIDSHDHSSGKGPKVTPLGLNINTDLSIGSNNLTAVRSLRLDNQIATLGGGSDLNAFYVYGGNAYFRNASGQNVQLTSAGTVAGASLTSSVWTNVETTSNLTINSSDTFISVSCRNTAPIHIQLPAISAVTAGRFYVIVDAIGQSVLHNITLMRAGSDTINSLGDATLASTGAMWVVRSDGVSNWNLVLINNNNVLTSEALTISSTNVSATGINVGASPSTDTSAILRIPNQRAVASARNAANNGNVFFGYVGVDDSIYIGDGTSNEHVVLQASANVSLRPAAGFISLEGPTYVRDTATVFDSKHINYQTPRTTYQALHCWEAPGLTTGGSNDYQVSSGSHTRITVFTTVLGDQLFMPVHPPDGATMTNVRLYWNLGGSSRSPGTRVNLGVFRKPHLSYGSTPTNMLSSTVVEVPAYLSYGVDRYTDFTVTQNNVIDLANYAYYIVVSEEDGGGATASNGFYTVVITYTVSRVTV